jgi:hypothetical protein
MKAKVIKTEAKYAKALEYVASLMDAKAGSMGSQQMKIPAPYQESVALL